jgi:sigma-B regulation protein RsbU (phosphoserine phosphatase)
MDREIEIAREVQENLFPKSVPRIHGLEVAGVCLPAAGVGGDYYDYLPLSENCLGLVVADVSGKGISAALVMASLQASVRNIIGPEATPRGVNAQLNRIIYGSTTPSRYATMFLGMFDASSRTLRYSNAGHNPALLIGGNGAQKLTEGGLPLGILDGVSYAEGSRVMEPGDLLLMYTDGAVEATNASGHEFSLDRLADLIQRQRGAADLDLLLQETVDRLQDWTRGVPQQDDITLVVARAIA